MVATQTHLRLFPLLYEGVSFIFRGDDHRLADVVHLLIVDGVENALVDELGFDRIGSGTNVGFKTFDAWLGVSYCHRNHLLDLLR